jgi:transcriptional regulator with GAF, ATPase, and Fis domain
MIDEKDFFREATLRLCGSLEIGKSLWNCFMFIRDFIPAEFMGISIVNSGLVSLEVIATADIEGGKATSIIRPIPPAAEKAYNEAARNHFQIPVFIINPAHDFAALDAQFFSNIGHFNQDSSVMILPTKLEEEILSFINIGNNQGCVYSQDHAQLFSLLHAPFDIAISNYLRYREVLRLRDLLEDNSRYFQDELRQQAGEEIIGANYGLKQIMDMVRQVAPLSSPILLLGETGTGKELIASAIHNLSPRKDGPFIKVNCGAIPETLVDSELFGHEKGAFTGALTMKRGRFERAHQGTIFLDEIGELPLDVQIRLLRVLQEKEIERVGGTDATHVDIRVVAATHRNLETMLTEGRFREDLYFRLNVFPMIIPPLRERRGDIPALVQHFMLKSMREMGVTTIPILAPGAMEKLLAYHWPGNVRELQNMVERALILSKGKPLAFDGLGESIQPVTRHKLLMGESENDAMPLDQVISKHILRSLEMTGGKVGGQNGAARLLHINPSTLRKKMTKLGIPFGRKARK